jgi:hypothetical protein
VRFISRKLGISPRTVYRYKDLQEPPPRQTYTTRASVLDPYVPYLLGRWNEGSRNGKRLLREIRERGYSNSERTFIRFTRELRRAEAAGKPPSCAPRARKGSVAGLSPTAKNVAALFMRREEKLSEEQREYLGVGCATPTGLWPMLVGLPRSSRRWSAVSKAKSWTDGSPKPSLRRQR